MFKIKKNINFIFGVIFAIWIIYTYGFIVPSNYETSINEMKQEIKK